MSELDSVSDRVLFDNPCSYLLSCIGFAVGLGNVWRFPKICLENGGGAFLIPYFIVFLLEGIPLMLIELIVGQRYRGSPVHSYGRMNKHLWGIGVAMMLASFYTALYYNSILAYAFIYFFNSFQPKLPWTYCPNNQSECISEGPSEWFFEEQVVMQSNDIEDTSGGSGSNGFVWHLYFATVISWVIVFLAMISGVKSLGKVVYFTALYPYVMLTVLLVIGIQLDGAREGLSFLFHPDFSRLKEPEVWLAASQQMFFSASLGFGGMISMSSRMPVRNNAFRDSIVILVVNSFTSIYASLGIFSIKGHMALNSVKRCQETSGSKCEFDSFMIENHSGLGLVFVAMATAVDIIGGPASSVVLSFLFYLMIISLGLDSAFGCAEGFISVLFDIKSLKKVPRWILLALFCLSGTLVALLFSTTRGPYFVDIFDQYGSVYVLAFVGFFEFVAIGWIHGIHKFTRDFVIVNDFHPSCLLKFTWTYISPFVLLAAIVGKITMDIMDGELLTYNGGERYPWWGNVLCLSLFFSAVGAVPICSLMSRCIKIDFGMIDYFQQMITSTIPPKEYSSCERIFCCVSEEFDFPENIQLRYVIPEIPEPALAPTLPSYRSLDTNFKPADANSAANQADDDNQLTNYFDEHCNYNNDNENDKVTTL